MSDISPVRGTLELLGRIKDYQYLSTKGGLAGKRVDLGAGTLYIRNALSSAWGRRATLVPEEQGKICDVVVDFLNSKKDAFKSGDLPLLGKIELKFRLMVGEERAAPVTEAYINIAKRFFPDVGEQRETVLLHPGGQSEAGGQMEAPESTLSSIIERGPAIATVNTCWFLKTGLSQDQKKECEKLVQDLYDRSLASEPFREEEWLVLARTLVVILENGGDPEVLEKAKDIFIRYYLRSNKNSQLPGEYLQLFKIVAKSTDLKEQIAFIRSSAAFKGKDPNATQARELLKQEYTNARWQENPLFLEGFTLPKPWRRADDSRTDREIINNLVHELAEKSVDELTELGDDLSVALLFILSSHTFQDSHMMRCKKDVRTLAKKLPLVFKEIGEKYPADDAERIRFSNFRKLYQFFTGSDFLTRMSQEERGKSSVTLRSGQAAGRRSERFSLWGFKGKSRELAGNVRDEFDMDWLHSCLEDARVVAVHEQKQSRKGRRAPAGDHFTSAPSPCRIAPSAGIDVAWDLLFNDLPIDTSSPEALERSKASWQEGQERALNLAQEIKARFERLDPPLEFVSILAAVQQDTEALKLFLGEYDDEGLTLLKEYVYPYVVLMRRAQTPFDHVAAKFIAGAASADEVASLGGENPATRAAVFKNVIRMMRPEEGSLCESVIHTSQIQMLKTMTGAIERGKQVYICNETGSGKTTMSKLAPEIVSFHVPMVLHVAPFTQSEKGWQRLSKWGDLEGVSKEETPHFWITAADLALLMQEGVPKRYQALFRKTFFLMDEYDSEPYSLKVADPSGSVVTSSIQDEVFFTHGCQRVANMSATPNLETFDNMMTDCRKKLQRYQDGEIEPNPLLEEHYGQKIGGLQRQREEMIQAMAREWRRQLTLKDLPAVSTEMQQVEQIFSDLARLSLPSGDCSYLVEMPKVTLADDVVSLMRQEMTKTFDGRPSALLFRDSSGEVQAHFCEDGVSWRTLSLKEFTDEYYTTAQKPTVVCFYAQDSVGGDFGIFSNERFVRGQYIVYPGEILPSYAIFQNMRRQRVNVVGGSAVSHSTTPVTFYMGIEAQESLQLSSDERAALDELDESVKQEETDALRKAKLIEKANVTAEHMRRLQEFSRLKMKTVRKKQKLLIELLSRDIRQLEGVIDSSSGEILDTNEVKKALRSALSHGLETLLMEHEANPEKVRRELLSSAIGDVTVLPSSHRFAQDEIEENEALVDLKEAFGGDEGLDVLLTSGKDLYAEIQRVINTLYNQQATCVDLWLKKLSRIAVGKKSPILSPKPSPKAVAKTLRRVRGGREKESVPDVDQDLPLSPQRHGVKTPAPDLMIKSLLGADVRDPQRARRFLRNLKAESKRAKQFQKEHREFVEEHRPQLARLKSDLIAVVKEQLPSISDLVAADSGLEEKAERVDQYEQLCRDYCERGLVERA